MPWRSAFMVQYILIRPNDDDDDDDDCDNDNDDASSMHHHNVWLTVAVRWL